MKLLIAFLLGLSALAAQTPHSATLTWPWTQGSGVAATGFQIQRGTVSGGPYSTVGIVSGSTTLTYIDVGALGSPLVEGQNYCYVVIAMNGSAAAPASPEKCGTVPVSAPNAVTGLTLTIK